MEFSHITPVPMNTLASDELMMVQSLSLDAPLISQSSYITVLVISFVFTIFTLLPIVPHSCELRSISSLMSLLMASFSGLFAACFTMNAANWLFSPWKSVRLPFPTSLSTDMRLPSPYVAPSVVSMVHTFDM